mgnify:CR=1 FL=1
MLALSSSCRVIILGPAPTGTNEVPWAEDDETAILSASSLAARTCLPFVHLYGLRSIAVLSEATLITDHSSTFPARLHMSESEASFAGAPTNSGLTEVSTCIRLKSSTLRRRPTAL